MTITANRRVVWTASAALLLASWAAGANAQPSGPGGMMGPGMMGPGMMGPGGFGRMCGPRAAGFAEWRVERMERVLKLTDEQRAKFDEFRTASNKAAETMRSNCPDEVPATMPGRMEAMEKRMDAMLQAIRTVRPSLDAFYATLTDEQKAQLDVRSGRSRLWRWRDRW